MKLPEKFKGIYTEQGQILDAREAKINDIIDYLTELHEQQKPCKHKNKIEHNGFWVCNDCKSSS